MCNLHWCYTFCTGVTIFALVLHLNCTALSQSESSNFFMYIIIWSIAAMLRDSVVVVRTRPRAIPLDMITMRKSILGFPFVSHIWDAYGAPLGGPLGRRSSAITNAQQAFLFVFHEGRQSLFSRSYQFMSERLKNGVWSKCKYDKMSTVLELRLLAKRISAYKLR